MRLGAAFIAVDRDGQLLLRKRVESGLLGGMTEVPTTEWTSRQDGETGTDAAPFPADWQAAGAIAHVFTHFELRLSIYRVDINFRESEAKHENIMNLLLVYIVCEVIFKVLKFLDG